jgi:hypothetical protein
MPQPNVVAATTVDVFPGQIGLKRETVLALELDRWQSPVQANRSGMEA